MNSCLSSILNAPLDYMKQIRKLKLDQILLKNTYFYPCYPLLLISSILCNLALSIWMMYTFLSSQPQSCYNGVTLGIKILSCIYPIYQIIIFIILIITITNAQKQCVKVILFGVFTIVATSFGFGGLGVVYTCIVHDQSNQAIPSSFLTQNYFIQIIVYAMLIFILMFLFVVPITTWLQSRRNPDLERTGCESCLYAFHIFFQILLLIGSLLFFALILGGIPILFYLLGGLSKEQSQKGQKVLFALLLISIMVPPCLFIISMILKHFIGCGHNQLSQQAHDNNSSKQPTQYSKQLSTIDDKQQWQQNSRRKSINLDDNINKSTRRQVLLEGRDHVQFGNDDFIDQKRKKSRI